MPNHVFSDVPKMNIPRSVFRRPFNLKTTIGADYLYPIYCDEALPGDTFMVDCELFGRLSTPVVPIMDDLYLDTFFFAVPIRLIDPNWKKIMGESVVTDPNTETFPEVTLPSLRFSSGVATPCSLSDYLGLPIGVASEVVPYWHRAYNLIYNEFFRDENLCPYAKVAGNTPDTTGTEYASDYVLKKRCKVHDYFTSCLPWPQKGNPVQLSLGNSAAVYGTGNPMLYVGNVTRSDGSASGTVTASEIVRGSWNLSNNRSLQYAATAISGQSGVPTYPTSGTLDQSVPTKAQLDSLTNSFGQQDVGLFADLSSAQSVTVNQLRQSFALQAWMERSARSGSRYVETILGHFNVLSPDARMQRPEYLGGSSQVLNVNSVPQTSATSDTSPQGNLAAFVTGNNSSRWTKSFTEHCVILGLANIRATLSYQQGLPRMFSRRTKYDFYWPEFANLGEQAVLNKEIYARDDNLNDDVFGYQERWAEYRYHPNMITGMFRSTADQSLDVWHLAQKFDSRPVLGQAFIESNTPVQRVLAENTNVHQQFILDGHFNVRCARPMPLYSVPSMQRL